MVPCGPDDVPAAGELRHLHEQQRVRLAAALLGVDDGELPQKVSERRVEELHVVQGAVGRRGDEQDALAGARYAEHAAAVVGIHDSTAGDGEVVDQSTRQGAPHGLGWLVDRVVEHKERGERGERESLVEG